ncbi:hypothetical protein KHC23_05385 [Ancylobacter dichloromethanicus]|uniref:Uncharacterized protein n=1 Tax=Ancylobacter dichloromethanicus TaxID=518825 RepID=A0A9W6JC87_9HYPH|nr:hypothetical protein [Ancylobacter dichloromethanicus]MBS7553081.1 hypothetical protein [Ancylobacter dichloromethanicus]GLK74597.1 hypothetical protein GCM10017643_47150 [Ancylobacter dichloromethanicus]
MRISSVLTSSASVPAALDGAELAAAALPGVSIEALEVVVDPAQMIASSEEISIQQLRGHGRAARPHDPRGVRRLERTARLQGRASGLAIRHRPASIGTRRHPATDSSMG